MLKEEKKYLKREFTRIINKVPKNRQQELHGILSTLNNKLEKYDVFFVNWAQSAGRLFSKNILSKMTKYVDDILDGYDKGNGYSEEDRLEVKNVLEKIIKMYDAENRTFLDKFLSVLGFS